LETSFQAIDRDSGKALWQRSEWVADEYPESQLIPWRDDLVLMEVNRDLSEFSLTRLRSDGRVLARAHQFGWESSFARVMPTLDNVVLFEAHQASTRLTAYSNALTKAWQVTANENWSPRDSFGHLIILAKASGGTRVIDARTGNGIDFSSNALLPDGVTVLDGNTLLDFFNGSRRSLPGNMQLRAIDATRRWLVFSQQERFRVFDFAANRIAEYPAPVPSSARLTMFNGRMLASGAFNETLGIDGANGNVIWRQPFTMPDSEVLLEGDTLPMPWDRSGSFLGTLETVMELDLQTGRRAWHLLGQGTISSSKPARLIKNRIRIDHRIDPHALFGLQAKTFPSAGLPRTDVEVKVESLGIATERWRVTVRNLGSVDLPAVRLYWSEGTPGSTFIESCAHPPQCAKQPLPQSLAMAANSAHSFVVSNSSGFMLSADPGEAWLDSNIDNSVATTLVTSGIVLSEQNVNRVEQ
jgi:hypothetical protein